MSGTDSRLSSLLIYSVILAVGHGVLLSSSIVKWEILVKQWKDALNALSIVSSDVLFTLSGAVMVFITVYKWQNWLVVQESKVMQT